MQYDMYYAICHVYIRQGTREEGRDWLSRCIKTRVIFDIPPNIFCDYYLESVVEFQYGTWAAAKHRQNPGATGLPSIQHLLREM